MPEKGRKVWVQAAIDVEDMETARVVAKMAVDCGAEWIEVGTRLLFRYGFAAISEIKKLLPEGVKLVADYKLPVADMVMPGAEEAGADFVIGNFTYWEFPVDNTLKLARTSHVQPIFFLDVKGEDMVARAKQLEAKGAKYLFLHKTYEFSSTGEKRDLIAEIRRETNCIIGVTSDDQDEIREAIDEGADWIIFGYVLREPRREVCQEWIDLIHNYGGTK